MFHRLPRERECISWLYAGLWTLFIYTCIPLARMLQKFVSEQWGRSAFMWTVLFTIGVALVIAVLYVRRNRAVMGAFNLVWLTATAAAFAYWTWHLRAAPEEAMHFVQYGILSLLVYRAMVHRVRDISIYFAVALLTGCLGALDEIIQWLTPRRYFEFRDIWINFGSAILMLIGVVGGIQPTVISLKPSPYGARWTARLATAFLVMLGLCASNTIPRVEWYASRIPGLDYLRTNESIMIEYGYRYEDPDIGVFYSRFPPDELARQDRERADEVAPILNAYRDPRLYGKFLGTFTPAVDPFAHEARVHLYRRDRYRGEAETSGPDESTYAYNFTVAYREHMIMEKYFSNTLHASRYIVGDEYLAFMRAQQIPHYPYVSAVSSQLVTRWREHEIWLAILLTVIVLEAGQRYYARRAP